MFTEPKMKMVMITYNEATDEEVMEVLEHCGMQNYTKIKETYGKGTSSGTHLGTDVWPGRNNIIYVACEQKNIEQLFSCVRELRKRLGREGIKAFTWDISELTG